MLRLSVPPAVQEIRSTQIRSFLKIVSYLSFIKGQIKLGSFQDLSKKVFARFHGASFAALTVKEDSYTRRTDYFTKTLINQAHICNIIQYIR